MDERDVRRPLAWFRGARRTLLLFLLAAGALAWWRLGLKMSDLKLSPGGWDSGGSEIAKDFFSAALRPALDYETTPVGEVPPFLVRIVRGSLDTLRFAGAAVTLSVVCGFILGFFASTAWWSGDSRGGTLRKIVNPAVYSLVRIFITLCRSIHELIWALLLLAALGLTPMAAVIAIAIPYTGTLAKVFSEMADEMPRDTLHALRAAGATPLRAYLLGLVPRALPDLFSYVLYRFECGMRSATVLSFMGFSTIGLYLQQAFDNSDYREAWTCLYAMLGMVLFFDWWSAAIRRRMTAGAQAGAPEARSGCATTQKPTPPDDGTPARAHDIDVLWRQRPRDRFLRGSLWALAALAMISLVSGFFIEIRWSGNVRGFEGLLVADEVRWTFSAGEWGRRLTNLERFMGEITPAPLRPDAAVTWSHWLGRIGHYAMPAAWTTLWISLVSIVLAGLAAWLTLPLASRVASVPRPWLLGGRRPTVLARSAWAAVRQSVKALHILTRAVPEVVLAFILLAIFGGNVWPAVLALALHNFGILGRLGAETVDNSSADVPLALRAAGASRLQIMGLAVFPAVLPRLLIYFFYRWETCLRESTALGILGCATLGYHIREVNSRFRYDEMMVLILFGAAIVILGDFVSALVRWWARRAV
jgi:phosphonate transport system permease protein